MQPEIIALGRSDNHPLLASHARSIGVGYRGIEAYAASDLMKDERALIRWIESIPQDRAVILAAIDASVPRATMNSFAALLTRELGKRGNTRFFVRTEPSLLSASESQDEGLDRDALSVLSVARSPHGQISTWPILILHRDGSLRMEDGEAEGEEESEEELSFLIDQIMKEVTDLSLFGVMNYVIDSIDRTIVRREFGASTYTFWSESACYTSITEQIVRSILDLPLGDTRVIDYEGVFLEEEFALTEVEIHDPTRPLLHLYARNPRLKVRYLRESGGESGSESAGRDEADVVSNFSAVRLSLYAATADEARHEMEHAREFIRGTVDEHAPVYSLD